MRHMSDSLRRDTGAIPARTRTAALEGPRLVALGVGLAAGALSIGLYARSGYGDAMLARWLVALRTLTTAFALTGRPFERPAWVELAVPVGLAALLSPLYLWHLALDWPARRRVEPRPRRGPPWRCCRSSDSSRSGSRSRCS
jgi:hypothetical protein